MERRVECVQAVRSASAEEVAPIAKRGVQKVALPALCY